MNSYVGTAVFRNRCTGSVLLQVAFSQRNSSRYHVISACWNSMHAAWAAQASSDPSKLTLSVATCSGVRLVYSANPGANLEEGLESFHWDVSLSVLHMSSYCVCPTLPGQFRKRPSCHSTLPDLKFT